MSEPDNDIISLEKKLDIIQDITKTGDWQWNLLTDCVTLSKQACRIMNLDCKCVEKPCNSMSFSEYIEKIPLRDRIRITNAFKNAKRSGVFDVKHLVERQNTFNVIVHFVGTVIIDKSGDIIGMIGTIQDITEHEHKHIIDNVINRITALSLEPISLKEIFNKVLVLISSIPWVYIESKGCIFLNDSTNKQLKLISHIGLSPFILEQCSTVNYDRCLCGKAASQRKIIFKDCLDEDHEIRSSTMADHGHYCLPIEVGDDLLGVLNLYIAVGHVKTKEEERFFEVITNTLAALIDRKNKQEKLETLAYFDTLTGLPNWKYFYSSVSKWIKTNSGKDGFAIFFIDLNKFKTINDLLGHHAGDLLLQQVADRLRLCIRQDDLLGRKSGDEFVLAIRHNDPHVLSIVAQKIIKSLNTPFNLHGDEGIIGVSIGIATFPHDSVELEQLIQKSDSAMFHAKSLDKSNYIFFSNDIQNKNITNQQISRLLQESVEYDMRGFSVVYQPQVNIDSGEIVGCEALMRWTRPDTGENVPPDVFIPIAEESNLINIIGEWIFREACVQSKLWQVMHFPSLRMCINVSTKQVRSQKFVRFLKNIIAEYDLSPENIEIEIMETSIEGREEEQLIKALHELSKYKLSLALDDYGLGQSSLRKLQKFPVNALKIDRTLIKDFLSCEDKCAIVTGIISFGQSLGKVVIAEGVETEHQRKSLLDLGCDEMQGDYFSPPVSAVEMEEMLLQNLIIMHKELGKGFNGFDNNDSWGWSIRKYFSNISK